MINAVDPNGSLQGSGYVLFQTDPKLPTIDLVHQLGTVYSSSHFKLIQDIVPKRMAASEKSSYSGNFGLQQFPLHTDLAHWWEPPRFILLRTIIPASVTTIIESLGSLYRALGADKLSRGLVRPRRHMDGRKCLLRLHDGKLFRWDRLFLQPADKFTRELYSEIDSVLGTSVKEVNLDRPGLCLLIDNWSVLHGRSAVNEKETQRHIQRSYLGDIHA